MNIGIVTNTIDTQEGGMGTYTENLVENLLKKDKVNQYFLIHTSKYKYARKEKNVFEVTLPFFSSIPQKLITGTIYFEEICKKYHLDILHDPNQISPFFFKSKTKKVLTIHDLAVFHYPHTFGKIANIYSKLFPMVLKNTDFILTDSENSKTDIQNFLDIDSEKIAVVHPGVDKYFKKIEKEKAKRYLYKKFRIKKPFLLFVGTIEPRKNILRLLKAFDKIRNQVDLKLVIVGKIGWKYKEVLSLLNKSSLKKNVIYLGLVTKQDLLMLYNAAEVFVYPSLYEGFGLPIVEAMGCKTPVITSDTSSLIEIAKDCALCVNPTNEEEIEKAILSIIDNPQLKADLISKGLVRAQNFSWDSTSQKILDCYYNIVKLKT